jgi:uncharacterized SAM-binding protein YcdF (DUF218 family)
VLLESVATTTEAEASEVRRMLGGRRLEPIVLVTSPMHMRRSLAAFRAMGLNPFPGASAAWPDRSPDACRWCPDDDALKISEEVVYNQVAYLYYWARGWTAEP